MRSRTDKFHRDGRSLISEYRTALAISAVGILVAAGCASGSGTGGDLASVPLGAAKEQYQQALAQMEPTKLTMQLFTGPDSPYSDAPEEYAAAVSDWSGGKVSFEILYSGSRANQQTMNSALAEQLVDIGSHVPVYEPQELPVNYYAAELMFLQDASPVVGSLQNTATWIEFGAKQEAIREELTDYGIQPLLPLMPSGGAALLCSGDPVTSLADARGKQIMAISPAHAEQIKALGATPVTLPSNEAYQAMQRGVVDCVASSLSLAATRGLLEVSDSWTMDSKAQFSGTPLAFGMSKTVWDSLPLPARQLLWDRLDVYIENHIAHTQFDTFRQAVEDSKKRGVGFHEGEADLTSALNNYYASLRKELPQKAPSGVDGTAFVQDAVDTSDKWLKVVSEDLRYPKDVTWEQFDQWLAANKVDLAPIVDQLKKTVLDPYRPSQDAQ